MVALYRCLRQLLPWSRNLESKDSVSERDCHVDDVWKWELHF